MNGLSVLKLFQPSIGDLLFSFHANIIYKLHKHILPELGQGAEVRSHYSTLYLPKRSAGDEGFWSSWAILISGARILQITSKL